MSTRCWGKRGSNAAENRGNGGGKQLMGEGKKKHLLMMNGGLKSKQRNGYLDKEPTPHPHQSIALTSTHMAGEKPFQHRADKTLIMRSNSPHSSSVSLCSFSMSYLYPLRTSLPCSVSAASTIKLLRLAAGGVWDGEADLCTNVLIQAHNGKGFWWKRKWPGARCKCN